MYFVESGKCYSKCIVDHIVSEKVVSKFAGPPCFFNIQLRYFGLGRYINNHDISNSLIHFLTNARHTKQCTNYAICSQTVYSGVQISRSIHHSNRRAGEIFHYITFLFIKLQHWCGMKACDRFEGFTRS